ncbi:MAG: succinate dehydrogenase assembly factor 2 [Pseudomonadota bacterium]
MIQTDDPHLKRVNMRSWRRGTREMDLILGPYSDAFLPEMNAEELSRFEALLDENDQDLYAWVSGKSRPPAHAAPLIALIAEFAVGRWADRETSSA